MTTLVNKVLLMAGLAGLSAAAGTVAVADDREAPPSVVLHYSNEALATDDGLRIFYHRLLRAAEKVCPTSPGDPLLITDAVRECREQAVANAVAKINNSRLAALVPHSSVKGT